MRMLMIILRDIHGNKRISWQAIKTAYQYAREEVGIMANLSNGRRHPQRGCLTRKIMRNRLRSKNGSSRIHQAWQKLQIKRLGGIKQYIKMRIAKKPRGEELTVTIY